MTLLSQLIKYYFYMIAIFFTGRLALFILYFDSFKNSDVNYWLTFIYGIRMDTITACMLLLLPTILLCFSPKLIEKLVGKFLKIYFLIVLSFLIYIEFATFPFFAQYDVRPNYLFVEYLAYPKELFSMIFSKYKKELFITFSIIALFVFLYTKYSNDNTKKVFKIHYLKRILLFIPLLIILFIGIRSSFGHRPANNSDALYSSNRIINELTKNSLYSIGYAIYANSKNSNKIKNYGKMDIKEALNRVKKRINIENSDEASVFKRLVKSNFKSNNPKNLVIFLQESMGYQFVEAVGGEKGITPHLNKLSKEGILFSNLYSNGTRSVRGIAGVTSGNFSVPGKGVVKRNKAQHDFFTFSSLLKPYGYKTSFIYGGESRFDNMKEWFLGNGFDKIIDQSKFKNPSFVGTWGVSDEDLVTKANEEFKTLYKNKQKFASLMFSTSNHSPFDFPEDKIALVKDVDKKSVKNAVKYADFAIGKFIEQAKKEDYYKDTIFVILADHNVRIYGNDVLPVNMFQIPGLILGKDIKPMNYENISSQPDVLATALDLIGLDLEYPIMGNSIFSDKKQNISLMQFYDTYALRVNDKVSIVRPFQEPTTYLYKNKKLIQTSKDEELEKDALAFVISLDYIYNKKLYK
ncbi:MAG: sulfatase [Arcobacter sp.]|nr:MAG: sulfatase [Arcobacter sp.]